MKELFSYIKNIVDIVDVIGHYVVLSQIGNYYKGLSPFKSEKTPSFTVTPEKKIFYCFSTHIGGDAIDFISRMENCSQYQAAMILVQRYNLLIDKSLLFEKDNRYEKDNYFKIYDIFFSWAEEQLKKNSEVKSYLCNRKIQLFSQQKYRIGYCPDSIYINDFLQLLQKNFILLDEALKTNIIQKKGKKLFFSCQDRIIFPIQNILNLYCAYGARIYLLNDIRPKYINSVGSIEFIKKNLLYGFSQARVKIKETKTVYFVEGYIDVIMMSQAGFENTVATMGTAISKHHVDCIKKFVDSVVIVYDGDAAGYGAIIKAVNLFWNESIDVYIVEVPNGEDPASLVEKGIIIDEIAKKKSIFQFFIQEKKKLLQNNDLKNISLVIEDIANMIGNIDDHKKQLSLILKVSTELNINQSYLLSFSKNTDKFISNNNINNKLLINKIEKDEIVNYEYKDKVYWYLFFYLTLCFYNINKSLSNKSIFLLRNFGFKELSIILDAYFKFNIINNNFLDFLKEYNDKLYLHCVKVMSLYNFSYKQYEIIYGKMIAISWKKYIEKNNIPFSEFLKLIDN